MYEAKPMVRSDVDPWLIVGVGSGIWGKRFFVETTTFLRQSEECLKVPCASSSLPRHDLVAALCRRPSIESDRKDGIGSCLFKAGVRYNAHCSVNF